MFQKQKNLQVKQNVDKIILRAGQIKDVIRLMFDYVLFTQERYLAFSKNLFQNLITFQTKIAKNCRYEPQKTNMILRLSKQYREFPGKIENYCQVNLNKIPKIIRYQQLNRHDLLLKKKGQTFYNEFRIYSKATNECILIYDRYIKNCNSLDEIIMKFKSYSDPLKFYDKSITSQYQQKLQSQLNVSKNEETKVTTELQLLDSKRKFLDDLIKQIRQSFSHLFQSGLKSIESTVSILIDTGKDNGRITERQYQADMPDPNQSSKHSQTYEIQFQRLNTFTSIIDEGNQIMSDFNQILKDKKSKRFNQQIVADHKLFGLRCQNLKIKKQKAFMQSLNLHQSLLELFEQQIKSYKQFQKSFKDKQRKIFGIKGKETFKKDIQTFFGHSTYKIHEFMFYIIESPRQSFQAINVWITDNYVNFKQVIESKKQEIKKFNKFYNEIMNQHLRQKMKFEESDPNDTQISQVYRANIVSSLDQFKYIFSQLEAREIQKDKIASEKLTLLYKFIMKQLNSCLLQNIMDVHKDKIQLLKNFKVISETMFVFKSDPLYSVLYEEFFSRNLQKSFQSKINKKQYDKAQGILKQKAKIAKKMLKREIGCCGFVKASPIQSQVLSTHNCYIYNGQRNSPLGKLKVLKEGLIFKESKWNPFAQNIDILIPKSDVLSIETKTLSNNQNVEQMNEGVSLNTEKGSLIFFSKQFDSLYSELQKIYGQTYRRSLALEKKGLTRNDSTQSGGFGRGSIMVSYNKQQNVFSEEPVCMNPALSRMSMQGSGSMDKKIRTSTIYPSAISINSEENKVVRSSIRTKQDIKQQALVRQMYIKLMQHYDKHQFLPEKFVFVQKSYKSEERRDYQFDDKETHNNFLLKELKKHQIIDSPMGNVLQITYDWKVTYPTSPSLHSFKHGQKIVVNLNSTPPSISITEQPHLKSQIFNRNFFYDNIKQMNNRIWKYIVQNTNKDFLYEPTIEKQLDPADNSEDIFIEEIKNSGQAYPQELEIRQSKIYNNGMNQFKPNSGQYVDFKGSNARSIVSLRERSNLGQTNQGLMKGYQI